MRRVRACATRVCARAPPARATTPAGTSASSPPPKTISPPSQIHMTSGETSGGTAQAAGACRYSCARTARSRTCPRPGATSGSCCCRLSTMRLQLAGLSISGAIAVQRSRVRPASMLTWLTAGPRSGAPPSPAIASCGFVEALAGAQRGDVVPALVTRSTAPTLSVEPVWPVSSGALTPRSAACSGSCRRRRAWTARREAELGDVLEGGGGGHADEQHGDPDVHDVAAVAAAVARDQAQQRQRRRLAARRRAARARRARAPAPTLPSTNAAQQNIAIAAAPRDAGGEQHDQREQRRRRPAAAGCAARRAAWRAARRSPGRCRRAARGSAPAGRCSGRTTAARPRRPGR